MLFYVSCSPLSSLNNEHMLEITDLAEMGVEARKEVLRPSSMCAGPADSFLNLNHSQTSV